MFFHLYIGSMFANKTTEMIADFLKYTHNKKGIIFTNSMDNRFTEADELIAHNKKFKLPAKRIDDPLDIIKYSEGYDVVAIDELQFMRMNDDDSIKMKDEYGRNIENIRDIIEYLIRKKGKMVLATGLISDYRRKDWNLVSICIPIADKVIQLYGICKECQGNSTTSYMCGHTKKDIKNSGSIIISSSSKFIPLCTSCYYKKYN